MKLVEIRLELDHRHHITFRVHAIKGVGKIRGDIIRGGKWEILHQGLDQAVEPSPETRSVAIKKLDMTWEVSHDFRSAQNNRQLPHIKLNEKLLCSWLYCVG